VAEEGRPLKIISIEKEKKLANEDREAWVGQSRMYLGDDNMLYVDIVGDLTDDMAVPLKEGMLRLMNMKEGQVNVLADLNRAGKPSAEVKKKGKEVAEHEKFGKGAMFGLHPVARVIASFWMSMTRSEKIRFFKTREEALSWLKE
jgi:hypothetical protein